MEKKEKKKKEEDRRKKKEEMRSWGAGQGKKMGGVIIGSYFSHLPKYLVGRFWAFSPLQSIANNNRRGKEERR